MRCGYRTKARFFRDSDVEVEIQWYKCAPGAETLGYPSAISSLDWLNYPYIRTGVGEVFNAERIYKQAPNIPGADGKRVCGTEEDFRQGGVYDPDAPPTEYSADGLALCCGGPGGGVLIGTSAPRFSGPFLDRVGGVVIGGAALRPSYCEYYTVALPSGTVRVRRVPGTYGWADESGRRVLTAVPSGPDGSDAFWQTSDFPARVEWAIEAWNGQDCASFELVRGTGPPTIEVCCDDA